jgi:hypothetical protein
MRLAPGEVAIDDVGARPRALEAFAADRDRQADRDEGDGGDPIAGPDLARHRVDREAGIAAARAI